GGGSERSTSSRGRGEGTWRNAPVRFSGRSSSSCATSERPMADFAHVLQRVEGRLRAPEPQRSRILLEMAQDLEALYGEYLARGYSEGESRARAEALLASSEEALEMLDGVHTSVAARLLRRLSAPGARGERRLLTLLGSFAVLAGSYPLFAAGLPYTRAINLAPLVLI